MSRQISATPRLGPVSPPPFLFLPFPSGREREGRRRSTDSFPFFQRLLHLLVSSSASPTRPTSPTALLFPTDFDFLSAFLFLVIRAKRFARHFFPYLSTRRSFLHPFPPLALLSPIFALIFRLIGGGGERSRGYWLFHPSPDQRGAPLESALTQVSLICANSSPFFLFFFCCLFYHSSHSNLVVLLLLLPLSTSGRSLLAFIEHG